MPVLPLQHCCIMLVVVKHWPSVCWPWSLVFARGVTSSGVTSSGQTYATASETLESPQITLHVSGHNERALQFRHVLPTVHCKELVCLLRHGQFLQRKCVTLLGQCCTVAKIASCHWAGSEATKDLKVVSSVGYSEDWPVVFSKQKVAYQHGARHVPVTHTIATV